MSTLRVIFKAGRRLGGGILVALWGIGLIPATADAAPARFQSPGNQEVSEEIKLDFDRSVRLALTQSPFLTKSSLEIEVRRTYESDARSDFLPSFNMRTRFFVNQPTQRGVSSRSYALDFISDTYNPVVAYFSLQAQKLITQVAVVGHMKVIAEGLHRLARSILELEAMDQTAGWQEMVALAQQQLTYAEKRFSLGETTVLELNLARQELELARMEKNRLAMARTRLLDNLKSYLAIPPQQKVTLEFRAARQQILGNHDRWDGGFKEALLRSFDYKVQVLKKELQQYNIMLAKAQLLPNFYMGVQNPDPLSNTDDRGYFVSLGFTLPVWDGFKRVRNISRQKTILKQYEAESQEGEIQFSQKWREVQENLENAQATVKFAASQAELARLKERQGEIRYHQGGEPFSVLMEGKKARLEAGKNESGKKLERDLAKLAVRHLSGELVYHYVDEKSWQK